MFNSHPRAVGVLGLATVAVAVCIPGSAAAAATAPSIAPAPAIAPAAASDSGLYGSSDPTYDGVYRQSWAILGLRSVGQSVPAKAVRWLTTQQCANGGFQSYRADSSAACPASDPATFSGPDSNSTALAAMALRSVGKKSQANDALGYLKTLQNADGGFAYYKGADSDANSTGLALAALRGASSSSATSKKISKATSWLKSVQLRCAATKDQGLVPYQAGGSANYLASAQAAIGLTTTLPAKVKNTATDSLVCKNGAMVGSVSTQDALLWGARNALKAGGGAVPDQFGSGKDLSSTAQFAIALGSAKQYGSTVTSSVKVLKRNAATYTDGSPAALGTLLVVADVTPDSSATSFGGVNLVKALKATLQ